MNDNNGALEFESLLKNDRFLAAILENEKAVKGMSDKVSNEGKRMDNFFKGMGDTVSGLIGPVSALAAAYKFKQLAQEAYDFEREFGMAMREVQTISQAVKDDFEGISDQLVQMAANGPDSAIKLAKAFYQIVSAGYEGEQGLKLLEISSRAATAGITDTTTAADGLTTVLNAWGLSADNAENVADVMFKTVERGKTTFGELASSIAQVAPLAASNNIEFEQIFAALQSITKQGTPTAQAMTQIRSSIVNMNNVLGDGWANTMTYQEGLNRVAEMAGGSQTKLKALIPDVEGVNAVLALTGEKARGAAEDLDATAESAGSMQTAYATMMQEADNKWDVIYNKWTRNVRELGKAMKEESGTIAAFADALLTNSEDLANSSFTILGISDRVKAMQASSGGGFWNGLKSYLLAPFVSDSMVQEGFDDFQKKIKAYAEQGLNDQKLTLDDILKIDDKDTRLEALNKFLEDLKKSEKDLGDTQLQNEQHQQAALALRAKLWGDVEAKAKQAIAETEKAENGGGGGAESIRTLNDMLTDLKNAKDKIGTGSLQNDVSLYQEMAAIQKEILEYTTAMRKLQNGESLSTIAGIKPRLKNSMDSSTLSSSEGSPLDWTKVFGDLDKVSTDALVSLRDKLKKYLSEVDDDIKPSDFAEITRAFDSIENAISQRDPFSTFSSSMEDAKFQTDKIKALKEQLEYYKEQGGEAETILKIEKQIMEAEDAKATAQTKATQAANKVGAIGQQAVSSGYEVIGMLEDMGISVSDSTKQGLEGVGKMADALAEVDFTKPLSIITASIKFTAGLVKSITGFFGGGNDAAKDTAELNRISERTQAVYEAINKLLESRIDLIKEATGAEAAYLDTLNQQTIEQQKQYLEQQLALLNDNEIFGKKGKNNDLSLSEVMDMFGLSNINEFIAWYNAGGYNELLAQGYGWTNQDSWVAIIDSWNNLTDAAKESAEAAQEAITGINFDSLKDSMDDLITSTDTTWADVADSFESHMQDAILNMVKNNYLTSALKQWYDNFTAYYSDGVLTEDELAKSRAEYNNAYQTAQDMYSAASDAAGISSAAGSYSGLTGSVQRDLTEETGTELAGLMRKFSDDTGQIRDYSRDALENMEAIKLNTAQAVEELQNAVTELREINTNTKPSSSSRDLGV